MKRSFFAVLLLCSFLPTRFVHAIEYLSEPELGTTPVFLTPDSVRLSTTPQGFGARPAPFWVLGSELRDASVPAQQFPNFFFPQDFTVYRTPVGPCLVYVPCTTITTLVAENPAVSVTLPSRTPATLSFNQDTTHVPVSCSQELNTFLYQESVIPPDVQLANFQGLAGLRGLTARFVHQVDSVAQAPTCPAPFAVAATLVGVKLWNPRNQTILNYQLNVFDSRGMQSNGGFWRFTAVTGETVYGVSDSIDEVYGLSTVEAGGPKRFFSVGILARVNALLAGNPFGLDPDLSHWTVRGFYSGTTTNGQAAIHSDQGSFGLAGF